MVRLRMLGSCDGCPSSSVTLTLAVETAIQAAAPETLGIEVEEAAPPADGVGHPGVGPALAAGRRRRVRPAAPGRRSTECDALAAGQAGGFSVAGLPVVVACGSAATCSPTGTAAPRCGGSLADGAVERRLGGRAGDAVLRCPGCRAHFDVRRAGRGLDGTDDHLEPVPLLVTDGVVSVAVPGAAVSA